MGGQELARAPKVTKADSMVDWQQMTTQEILRRLRVFGGVWDDVLYRRLGGLGSETRVVYKSLRAIPTVKSIPPGTPFLDGDSDVAIRTVDGAVQVVDCTISGGESGGAGVRELAKRLGRLR
jgi:methionyl-tRNA formyltransferase